MRNEKYLKCIKLEMLNKNSKTRYIIKVLTPINSKMYTTTKELLEK